MRLRKECEHGRWDDHTTTEDARYPDFCPGGEFLPEGTLVIEKVDGEWPEWAVDAIEKPHQRWARVESLDALFVALSARRIHE